MKHLKTHIFSWIIASWRTDDLFVELGIGELCALSTENLGELSYVLIVRRLFDSNCGVDVIDGR